MAHTLTPSGFMKVTKFEAKILLPDRAGLTPPDIPSLLVIWFLFAFFSCLLFSSAVVFTAYLKLPQSKFSIVRVQST